MAAPSPNQGNQVGYNLCADPNTTYAITYLSLAKYNLSNKSFMGAGNMAAPQQQSAAPYEVQVDEPELRRNENFSSGCRSTNRTQIEHQTNIVFFSVLIQPPNAPYLII